MKKLIVRCVIVVGFVALAAMGALVVVAIFSSTAQAQTPCPTAAVAPDSVRVCIANATTNEDGSAIPATGPAALNATDIYRSLCNADDSAGVTIETVTVPPSIGFTIFSGLPPGRHCFRGRHVNNAGIVSGSSPTFRKTTTAPAPPKPRQPNLTIA